MPLTWKDRVKQAVTAGGTGALTLGAAASGYQALGAADDGAVLAYVVEDGTAWETGLGTYTHAGTSFARTVRYASSTGAALNVTTSAVLFHDLTATGAQSADIAVQGVVPGGRLTLATGVPVPATDFTNASTIYYTPHASNVLPLWDGYRWRAVTFAETALALGTVTPFAGYDVFAYLSGSSLALEKLAWRNASVTMTIASPCVVTWVAHNMSPGDPIVFSTTGALPTGLVANTQYFAGAVSADTIYLSATPGGATINTSGSQSGTHTAWQSRQRGTAVTLQDGRLCKSGDKTRLLLGAFLPTSTTGTEDSAGGVSSQVGGKRFLSNVYNQVNRGASVIEGTSSWTYNGAVFRQSNGAAGNKCEVFTALPGTSVIAQCTSTVSVAAGNPVIGIGVDSVTDSSGLTTINNTASSAVPLFAAYEGVLGAGYHFIAPLESGSSGSSITWTGQIGASTSRRQAGLVMRTTA